MYENSVSNLIKKEIMQNAMSGEKYITESTLCVRTGISRTKLRETLKTLDSHGMIERKQKCGVALCSYSREELKELYELRILLESRGVNKTVKNASEQDLFELQQISNEIELAVKMNNRIESAIKDSLFHRKLVQISGGKTTLRIVDSLRLIENTMDIAIGRDISPDPYTHVDMIEAIRNKDVKTYKKLLVNHIKWIAREMLKYRDNSKRV